jgi:hypothetical protein
VHVNRNDTLQPGGLPGSPPNTAGRSFTRMFSATASAGAGSSRALRGGYPPGTSPNWGGFQSDPVKFLGSHLLRTDNAFVLNSVLPASTPGGVSPGDHSIVAYTISPSEDNPHKVGQLHVFGVPGSRPAVPVSQSFAYLAPFNGGTTSGVSVPAHPTGAQPTVVLTAGLGGCGFYAKPDEDHPNNVAFYHKADAMGVGGNSNVPEGGIGIDWEHNYGRNYGDNGTASAFAFYDQKAGNWMIAHQNSYPFGSPGEGLLQLPVGATGVPGSHSGSLQSVDFNRPGEATSSNVPPPESADHQDYHDLGSL